MREVFDRLEHRARLRSTGLGDRRATGLVQLTSALCFLAAGASVGRPWLALLLLAEALGQLLLSHENLRRAGHHVVRYFGGPLGAAAVLTFSGTIVARAQLGAHVMASGLALVILLTPLVQPRWPRDLCAGLALTLSSLALALASPSAAALGQLAYAAVLVGGVVALRPWQAELINVPVFLGGCWLLQHAA